jgi:hypothetical protein
MTEYDGVERSTATETFRAQLDERGVEWWEDAFSSEHRTVFDGKNGVRYCVYQLGFELFISSILPVTPEQAIAATLGRGTCHDTGTFKSWGLFTCSNCSIVIPLNAVKDAPSVGKSMPLKFCPNCGREVVDE